MMRKMFSVFLRDLRIASKDPMSIWIFTASLLFAVIINLVSPGINDTTVNLAVDKTAGQDYISKVGEFADIEVFETREQVIERVRARDEVLGITFENGEIKLISQGNETEESLKLGQIINSLYHLDLLDADNIESRLSFYSFNEKIPGLKRALSVSVLLMNSVIIALLVALGLVDEKSDKTIRAANVTPVNPVAYMLGKSIIGIISLFVTSVLILLILGLTDINWSQMLIMNFAIGIISIIVSFSIGLSSSDFIEAAASIKMMMVPMLAAILVYELLNEKWHFTMYWNPFFWADKGITEIIEKTATWGGVTFYTGIILVICSLIFLVCRKNIKKHMN